MTKIFLPYIVAHPVLQRSNNLFMRNLIAHYKLDEYAGTRYDATGRYHLAEYNGYFTYAPGKLGNAVNANTNGLALIASKGYTESLANGFTVAAWVNLHSIVGRHAVVNSGFTNNSWKLWQYAADDWRFTISDSVTGDTTAKNTTIYVIGEWYFLVGRYNPTTKKAELNVNNGTKAVAASALTNVPDQTYKLIVLGNLAGDETYGLIDSVSMWWRYLSDAEITTLYNSGNGLEFPFLSDAAVIEATEAYEGSTWYVEP